MKRLEEEVKKMYNDHFHLTDDKNTIKECVICHYIKKMQLATESAVKDTLEEIADMEQHDSEGFSKHLRHQIWGYNEALTKSIEIIRRRMLK